jgi:hypothetical protein
MASQEKNRKMQLRKEKKKLQLLGMDVDEVQEMREVPAMDELVKQYLRRHEDRIAEGDVSASKREQEYYSQLLLGRTSSEKEGSGGTIMGRKSQLIENAYAFALRQQQVLLQGDVKGMMESALKVEELLEKEAKQNRKEGHEISKKIKSWRDTTTAGGTASSTFDDDTTAENTHLPSILHSKPRSIRALSIWSARLQSIPYHRWTIGATTALDHWIAREVLGMDENTWNLILEGGGADVSKLNVLPGGETKGGVKDRMRDVVVTREALFPETVAGGRGGAAELAGGELSGDLEDETSKSIDALLASLGSFDDDDEFKFDDFGDDDKDGDGEKNKESLEVIMNELQEWRAKNVDSPYEKWDAQAIKKFDVSFSVCGFWQLLHRRSRPFSSPQQEWIEKYVSTLSSESSTSDIDLEATRKALLSQPPIDSASSKDFWTNIRNETEAENFLQDYRSKAEKKLSSLGDAASLSESDKALHSELQAILDVPYERQLRKLVNMGAIRPILDEYIEDSDRQDFLEKYSSIFLEGLELECLVPDRNGPIALDDLGPSLREEFAALHSPEERFRIEKIAYGTDEFGTERAQRARDLYRMWNEHKSNRARFEEAMFRKGFMNLEDKPKEKRDGGKKK